MTQATVLSRTALVIGLLSLTGCPETTSECEPGFREEGDRCVPIDADGGPTDAGPTDGNVPDGPVDDAGPCGMTCSDPTPFCDATGGMCVACLMDSDCTEPGAAKCDAGECVECDASSQCAGITGTEVCATRGDNAGDCVECQGDERAECGSFVCDATTNTCSTEEAGMTGLCQPCVSDEQCRDGMTCVPTTFGDPASDTGAFCLWELDAPSPGPAGACTTVRPYREAVTDADTIDGDTVSICGLRTSTCPGLNDFDTGGRGGSSCTLMGDDCGVSGLEDAECVMVDAATNRCTVPCLSDDDCLAGVTCDTGSVPRLCNL